MKTSLTKQNYNTQSHFIVNAKYSFNRNEIDLILSLLTAIKKEDKDFKDYVFDIRELEEKTSKKWNSLQLQENAESLMSKSLKIQISKNNWKIFNWFSYFEYDNGLITCRFDKALKPYLLELKNRFIISDLRMILPMRSSYSKRIYLLLKEYAKIGKRTFDVEELQEMLLVPLSYKNKYNKFKISVLQKAQTDINKFTDLEVSFTEKKRVRKVVEITYTIRKNHNDLKSFISYIKEVYVNELLFYTKENRPLKCSAKGFLYYSDNNQNIEKKEALKLWEYLHENRRDLYIFKVDQEEILKNISLLTLERFKNYVKEKLVHKKIVQLKKSNTDERFDLSIFPNGNFYDMSGDTLEVDSHRVWELLYGLAKNGKLKVLSPSAM